eukprot:COSAG05_NODE_73_length_21807_cov_283.593698_22_plen_334_part_00
MVLPQPVDSPAKNTRSKIAGRMQQGTQPLKMKAGGLSESSGSQINRSKDAMLACNNKRKATEMKDEATKRREGAAERRKRMEDERTADLAAKLAAKNAKIRTGSNPSRTGSGSSVGRTGSNERPIKKRQPTQRSNSGAQRTISAGDKNYKDRLELLEEKLNAMVENGGGTGGITDEGNGHPDSAANMAALLEQQTAAHARVEALSAQLKAAEESAKEQIGALRSERDGEIAELKEKQATEMEALRVAHSSELAELLAGKTAELDALGKVAEEAAAEHESALAASTKELAAAVAEAEQLNDQLTNKSSELSSVRSAMEATTANLMAKEAQAVGE